MKRLQAIFVIALMLVTHYALAKPPKRKAQPAIPPYPILCSVSAAYGTPFIVATDSQGRTALRMPYRISCTPGTSGGCTYSSSFQIFQRQLTQLGWQWVIVDEDCQNLRVDCGTNLNTEYDVPNLRGYGRGSWFATLTTYQGTCTVPGSSMSVEWIYFDQ